MDVSNVIDRSVHEVHVHAKLWRLSVIWAVERMDAIDYLYAERLLVLEEEVRHSYAVARAYRSSTGVSIDIP